MRRLGHLRGHVRGALRRLAPQHRVEARTVEPPADLMRLEQEFVAQELRHALTVRCEGRWRSASNAGHTFRCSRIGLICGGKVSPTRSASAAGASTMQTLKAGAKS